MIKSFLIFVSRHWLCVNCDRISTKRLLHRHLGLGTLLPVSVLSARAALGKVQAALEHRALRGGHSPQEQDPLAGSQCYQLHLPCHRVLGVSKDWQLPCATHTFTWRPVTQHFYLQMCLNRLKAKITFSLLTVYCKLCLFRTKSGQTNIFYAICFVFDLGNFLRNFLRKFRQYFSKSVLKWRNMSPVVERILCWYDL